MQDADENFLGVCAELLALEKNRATLLDWLWSNEHTKVEEILIEMQQNLLRARGHYKNYCFLNNSQTAAGSSDRASEERPA